MDIYAITIFKKSPQSLTLKMRGEDMDQLQVNVGARLRVFRNNRGLTQQQLGEIVELPQSYIGGIERG